jgi:hypothetical protein
LRRWEWNEQKRLATLLALWLPEDAFWTATDPYVSSAMSGWARRLRGVKPGVPDTLIWVGGRSICIELKAPGNRCSRVQREVRAALIAAGADWWEARTANAAMAALMQSGVTFREIVGKDGTIKRWEEPKLAEWEQPRRDPRTPLPQHPEVAAARREYARRRRERMRAEGLTVYRPRLTREEWRAAHREAVRRWRARKRMAARAAAE